MNYVLRTLIHLYYFQSCLIEYCDLLCIHVLICIWFTSPDLADWPWSSLEGLKKKSKARNWEQYTNLYICVYQNLRRVFYYLKKKGLNVLRQTYSSRWCYNRLLSENAFLPKPLPLQYWISEAWILQSISPVILLWTQSALLCASVFLCLQLRNSLYFQS